MPTTSMRTAFVAALFSLAACGGGSGDLDPPGQPPPTQPPGEPPAIALEPVFQNLAFIEPLAMLQAPGDSSRWFVVEKDGFVLDFANDPNVQGGDVFEFVDLTTAVDSTAAEAGLLGMAFHPDFQTNGEVFLSYTRTGPGGGVPFESVVSRFIADPETLVLDPGTEEILLTVDQPFGNHNGGNIVFGPDGFLYIGFGDGGGSGDPEENGQDTTNLLGTILRIDVDGADPYAIPADNPFAGNTDCRTGSGTDDCPEIFAWGFRNPWRFTFDRDTDELWVADVGQNAWEEVNRVQISENYGWNDREGAHCFDPPDDCSTDNVDPITEYSHDVGNSITGGYVYRGSDFPELVGFYVFGDFVSGRIWSVPFDSEQGVEPDELIDTPIQISSFAESNDGELYLMDFDNGSLHRIVTE